MVTHKKWPLLVAKSPLLLEFYGSYILEDISLFKLHKIGE